MVKININETKFLNRTSDLKHKDIVTIINEASWEESRFKKEDGSPQQQFNIKFRLANGEERGTALNWTNVKLLVQAFGDDTKNWIDKDVRAWKTKSEKAKGGFTFLFVPTDWERDDTGEWIFPEGSQAQKAEAANDGLDEIDFSEDEIDPADIPFESKPKKK